MGRKCCITGCKIRCGGGIPLYMFPTDYNRKCEWLNALRLNETDLIKSSSVCFLHFRERDTYDCGPRILLHEWAVPRIKPYDEDEEDEPIPDESHESSTDTRPPEHRYVSNMSSRFIPADSKLGVYGYPSSPDEDEEDAISREQEDAQVGISYQLKEQISTEQSLHPILVVNPEKTVDEETVNSTNQQDCADINKSTDGDTDCIVKREASDEDAIEPAITTIVKEEEMDNEESALQGPSASMVITVKEEIIEEDPVLVQNVVPHTSNNTTQSCCVSASQSNQIHEHSYVVRGANGGTVLRAPKRKTHGYQSYASSNILISQSVSDVPIFDRRRYEMYKRQRPVSTDESASGPQMYECDSCLFSSPYQRLFHEHKRMIHTKNK